MAEKTGTLEKIAEGFAVALQQLTEIAQPANLAVMLNELGMDNPPDLSGDIQLAQNLTDVVTHATELIPRIEELILSAEEGGASEIVTAGAAVIAQCSTVAVALDAVATHLQSLLTATPGGPQLAAEFSKRIRDNLIARYLDAEYPLLRRILTLVTIVEWDIIKTEGSAGVVRSRLHLDRLPKLLSDPLALLASGYGWGRNDFDASGFLQRISELFEALDPIAAFGDDDGPPIPPVLDLGVFTLSPAATTPPGLAGEIFLEVADKTVLTLSTLSEDWRVLLSLGGKLSEGITVKLVPPTGVIITPPSGTLDGRVALELVGQASDPTRSILLLSAIGSSRVEAKSVSLCFVSVFHWNAGSGSAEGDFGFEGQIQKGKLLIGTKEADGFLSKLLSGLSLEADFDVGFGWTASRGVYFTGSSALEVQLPTHISLGPIDLTAIKISIGIQDDRFPIGLSTDIRTVMGPLTAVIQDVGISATLNFPPDYTGNLGPLQLALGFKPPNGVGLAVNTSLIKGGGFLYLDSEKGEYLGALELDFQGMFSLKAVGIINTKLPDGSSGFALLIIITTEFTPIQLSFGFTLNGVGGLLGLNRTTRIEVLREGVKTNALKSVLFPEDVVANINRIVSDLKQVFPIQADRFIVGPMAKIGWGTPSIITLELGLLLEIPVPRIAILGVLKAILPEENTAVLKMQVNFLGVIDFENKYISFDASLYDSRLLVYTLTGDMAFRLSWGDNPLFILSVGGFHPEFKDIPSDLQRMTRLSISLLSGNNPRISIQCYFAVTSNTVQFGAKAELYAAACGFNVYGFVGFDVLFHFDPFHFIAAIYAGLALRCGSTVLMSIKVAGELAGPTPWDVRGEASFSILFFDITISFHETWGDRIDKVEPEKVDIIALLSDEIYDTRNWKAEIPDNNNLHVTIKQIDLSKSIPRKIEIYRFENNVLNRIKEDTDKQFIQGRYNKNTNENCYLVVEPINDVDKEKIIDILKSVHYYNLVIHPFGVLTFSERLVPLGVTIDKFGNSVPIDDSKFELTDVKCGNTNLSTLEVKEQFARANFFNMTDNEKLSHASFDRMPSGFKIIASAALMTAKPVNKNVDYELTYLRKKQFKLVFAGIYRFAKRLFKTATKGSAVAKSSLSHQNKKLSSNAPEAVAILTEKYVIANVSNMQKYSPELTTDSYSEASELYRGLINQKPELKDQIQIVSEYEMSMN